MLVLPVGNQFFKWPERARIIKMQPLGAIGDLEADASCQEEEDEEEEAVWLREHGHCIMTSIQNRPFQASAIGCTSNRRGRLPGVLGRHGRAAGVFFHGG